MEDDVNIRQRWHVEGDVRNEIYKGGSERVKGKEWGWKIKNKRRGRVTKRRGRMMIQRGREIGGSTTGTNWLVC